MRKGKLPILLAALLLCVGLCLLLGACGKRECKHSYTETVTVEVGCENDGLLTYLCADCGDSYTETVTAPGHDIDTHEAKAATCLESGWQAYETCKRCDYTSEYVEIPKQTTHTVANGRCTVCNVPESTPGLDFSLNSDRESYMLEGIGTCTETDLVVGLYKGKSVTRVIDRSFVNETGIKSLTIGDCVTSIGKDAFDSCTSLEHITFGEGLTSIGSGAFYYCIALESVELGDNVTSIGELAFMDCRGLKSITVGCGMQSIGKYAFMYCMELKSIKYRGTAEQWDAIVKEDNWDYLAKSYQLTFDYKGE